MSSNKEKVIELQRSVETRDLRPLRYIHPERYKQHNLQVGDGLAAILALHEQLPADQTVARPLRAIQDGDLAAVHVEYNLWGPKVGFDIHRFEDGLIVEHWDNLEALPTEPNPSGHTMVDGETEVQDLNQTVQNKELVCRFVDEVLIGHQQENIDTFFYGDSLVQHNRELADGGRAFAAFAGSDAASGRRRYVKRHMLLGEGNFVLCVGEGHQAERPCAFYDLFRVANGYLVEHWDVTETVPQRATWKNGSGKF